MSRLLVANEFNEDRTSLVESRKNGVGWWTQRILWFARDGDILVMAARPDADYLRYVCGMIGVKPSALRILVPPPGAMGGGVLTSDRLLNASLLQELSRVIDGKPIDRIIALHPDASVAELADRLGATEALEGSEFLSQGGGRLVNSKVIFRSIAAGLGLALPPGAVCTSKPGAHAAIWKFLSEGQPVILKHEFRAGGRGNEILSPYEGLRPVGAQRAVLITDEAALQDYLQRRWDWLSSYGSSPFVVEQYFPDSRALFAEFVSDEKGVHFGGQGELLSAPLAAGMVTPIPAISEGSLTELLEGARALSGAVRHIGYRGVISADAVLTPAGQVLFTEYNCRITGTTHCYEIVGKVLVGTDYSSARVLVDRDGWEVPSFGAAVGKLADHGLAYDHLKRSGVMLIMPYNPGNGTVRYCAIENSLEAAMACSEIVEKIFVCLLFASG